MFNVELSSQTAPFLYPNTYCWYTPDSQCVKRARRLTTFAQSDVEKIKIIYDFICNRLVYDKELAAQQNKAGSSFWLPNPDWVLARGKGICWEYASLFAGMLRPIGIPCKIVVGPVQPNGITHAWNQIWSKEDGEIVGIPVKACAWTRIDITLMDAANNSAKMAAFVQGDGNYEMKYCG